MNIIEAKNEIKRSVEIYLDKNEFGEYTIPVSKQRPIFMVGAPGIGKAAIMRQIASELDIALVSCSMSHYTRHSALGRPVIKTRDFDGTETAVSEYTMSEILAAVYHVMRDSGKREGILFLDEINCVHETLAPAICLFLRYKTFGNRQVPEGWTIVTAGSPLRYHKSAREFEAADMDRLKRIEITEDFPVWKQYAYEQGIHAAVTAFLEINRQCFYSICSTAEGPRYVTARGWEDLSAAMQLYEKKGFPISRRLIGQYITDEETAERFGMYYDLFQKYKADYRIGDILSGRGSGERIEKLGKADMEERFSVLGLLMETLGEGFRNTVSRERILQMTAKALRSIKKAVKEDQIPVSLLLQEQADGIRRFLRERTAANNLTGRERKEYLSVLGTLTEYARNLDTGDLKKDFEKLKKQFVRETRQHEKQIVQVKSMLEEAFSLIEKAWGNHQEMAFFLAELANGADSMAFISRWGCESYFRYHQERPAAEQEQSLTEEPGMLLAV